jgi:hypothetical protein
MRKLLLVMIALSLTPSLIFSETPRKPTDLRGIYIPATRLSGRSFEGLVHYLEAADLNLAVLHAKDPLGRLYWNSRNPLAYEIGASVKHAALESAVRLLNQKGIWAAAKLDVFQDSLLVRRHPDMGVLDSQTKEPWEDRKGLHWANPYDRRVWDYVIELSLELVAFGVDEIQFDYIRFPSDGNLSVIEYPQKQGNLSRQECIGEFLAYTAQRLKPSGVLISVDVFGLTAWKATDFGIGQVLEHIAPHVDVICPMLYPSHFPKNFLALENPGQYPYKIMRSSLEELQGRTNKRIRPWIQGFWYQPEEIIAQLEGAAASGISSWTVWNPGGDYTQTLSALEQIRGAAFPPPHNYPSLGELCAREDLVVVGRHVVINHTCYRDGYSILSLDESTFGSQNEFSTISDVVSTLDESIIDMILTKRSLRFSAWTTRQTKEKHIADMIIQDLAIDPLRMRADPFYIDWRQGSAFTRSIPKDRLDTYQQNYESQKIQTNGKNPEF